MAGDMNGKTPFTITSEGHKLGIRFRSSSLFNFRGFKITYIVSCMYDNFVTKYRLEKNYTISHLSPQG